jgi:cyanate lyase
MTKTRDDYLVDCILCNQKLAEVKETLAQEKAHSDAMDYLALGDSIAEDTIRIALAIAGYNPHSMNQFERASALLDMAQEYIANRESLAHYESVFDKLDGEIANARKRDRGKGL